jgi:hypothetical protein
LRDIKILDDGRKYLGEWIVGTEIREGKGGMIWPDGSLYEGWCIRDKANGKGRKIDADGNVYDGFWKDDKSHGYGIYTH